MNFAFLFSAFALGVLGSTHCVAMCGGVVAMAQSSLPLARRARVLAQLPYLLGYNGGRIAAYSAAGALAGSMGTTLASFVGVERLQMTLRLVAAMMMIAVGFYIAGMTRALSWVERVGAPVWRRISPLARGLLPIRSPLTAVFLGALWGFLPCGLVYTALAAAVTSGSPSMGAATMLAFGLGTLPTLLAMGSAAAVVARAARRRWVRAAAGAIVLAFGVAQVAHVGLAWGSSGGNGFASAACCAGGHHPR